MKGSAGAAVWTETRGTGRDSPAEGLLSPNAHEFAKCLQGSEPGTTGGQPPCLQDRPQAWLTLPRAPPYRVGRPRYKLQPSASSLSPAPLPSQCQSPLPPLPALGRCHPLREPPARLHPQEELEAGRWACRALSSELWPLGQLVRTVQTEKNACVSQPSIQVPRGPCAPHPRHGS